MTFRVQGTPRALHGEVIVPGDKSIAHRAVLFSAMASGRSEIRGFPTGEDNLSTVAAMRALGCRIDDDKQGTLLIYGQGRSTLKAPSEPIDCGNSGGPNFSNLSNTEQC